MSAPAAAPPETPTTWREAVAGLAFCLAVLGGLTAAGFATWPDDDSVSGHSANEHSVNGHSDDGYADDHSDGDHSDDGDH